MTDDRDRNPHGKSTAAAAENRLAAGNRCAVPATCALLVAAVAFVFGQTVRYDFTNFDDDLYVTANPHVTHGLSVGEIGWAFTHFQANHWLPMVWISYMVDSQFYGPWAGGYHLTNVLLHACTTIVLFLVLRRFTSALWPNALVAALFAIHPLRVESVAWVTERKDVLSGLLFALTLGAYVGYARRPFSLLRYLSAVICFVLGLMAKPMLVTLPFVLLLLDYWPLARLWPRTGIASGSGDDRAAARRVIVEKVPFFVFSAISCIATILSVREDISALENVPWGLRLANAAISCVAYLGQMVWPRDLAAIYPLPRQGYSGWETAAAAALLGLLSLAAMALRKRHPYLLTGWLWYMAMLLPVIGLLHAGEQARADRFTYLPQIGVYLALAWGATEMCRSWPLIRWPVGIIVGLAVAGLMICARHQTTYWRDSMALWTHTLACTSENATAENHMGLLLSAQGHVPEAIEHFERALRIRPDHANTHNNLGNLLFSSGRLAEATEHYRQAVRISPGFVAANNLGNALIAQGKISEGIEQYQWALRIRPNSAIGHANLGIAMVKAGRIPEAIEQYEQALRIDPDYADAHYNLALRLAAANRIAEAVEHFQQALRSNPNFVEPHIRLGYLFAATQRLPEAIQQFHEALRIQPNDGRLHATLGIALIQTGEIREAGEHFLRAASLMPDDVEIHRVLAWVLATHKPAEGGDPVRAVEFAERACLLTGRRDIACLDTLATAYADAGRFDKAVKTAIEAQGLAEAAGQWPQAEVIAKRLRLYRDRKPYRETADGGPSNR
jgi:tetratricopeptide (TPR) repeat protein